MSGARPFPEDFPVRLERLKAASGLTWRSLARAAGVSVRSVYRWRAGAQPDATHLLALVEFATDRGMLDLLLPPAESVDANDDQQVLFRVDVWAALRKSEGPAAQRAATASEQRAG